MCLVTGFEIHGHLSPDENIKVKLVYCTKESEVILVFEKDTPRDVFHPIRLRDIFVGKSRADAIIARTFHFDHKNFAS